MELVEREPGSCDAQPAGAVSALLRPGSRRPDLRHRFSLMPLGPALLATDLLVLTGYCLMGPTWSGPLGLTWILTVLLKAQGGLYRERLHLSVLDELPGVTGRGLVAIATTALTVSFWQGTESVDTYLGLALCGLLGHLAGRALLARGAVLVRRHAPLRRRTLVIGAGEISHRIARTLQADPGYGLEVVGYLDDETACPDSCPEGWVHRGGVDDLPEVVRRHRIQTLVVGFGLCRDLRTADILRSCRGNGLAVFVVPRLFEIGRCDEAGDRIGAIPVQRLDPAPLRPHSLVLKRGFDLLLAGVGLVVLSPAMALVALAVRWEGGRGVIFRQERVGRDGRVFQVLKFRSLRPTDQKEAALRWSIAHDDRLGRVGRFIRATSLDELPQLVNVLRGDMTLVGPRPERPHFVQEFSSRIPHYGHRHRVPVGLTGLAQVSGLRGDTSIDERARLDNYYIENWSLWLDVKVLLHTVRQVLCAKGR